MQYEYEYVKQYATDEKKHVGRYFLLMCVRSVHSRKWNDEKKDGDHFRRMEFAEHVEFSFFSEYF